MFVAAIFIIKKQPPPHPHVSHQGDSLENSDAFP